MDAEQLNNEAELKFTIRNYFKDVYIGHLILACLPPYLWINIAILAFNFYYVILPFLQVKEYALALFTLAFSIVLVSCIALMMFLMTIALTFFKTRLKGVVGEHEYTFRSDGFTEKTPYNEHNLHYESVARFLETRGYFLLGMPSMNTYMLPKRDLSTAVQENLRKRFQGIRPVKRIFAPYVVFSLVAAAAISLGFAMTMAKYTVITNSTPFHAVWDANALYISGGKTTVGQMMRYSDMVGIGMLARNYAEPQSVTEQLLWVVKDGKTDFYTVQTPMKPMTICLHEGKLYTVHFDMKTKKKVLSYFTPEALVEDQSKSADELMQACLDADPKDNNAALNGINLYEWDEKVGIGKTLQIPLGGALFGLGMTHEEGAQHSERGLLGDTDLGTMSLTGNWVTGQTGKREIQYTVSNGMKIVNKETYQQIFH